jgi:hypothetical protein
VSAKPTSVPDVLDRLRAAMEEQDCLCLYSRCPLHGESEGVLAAAYSEIVSLRPEAAFVNVARKWSAKLDEEGIRWSPEMKAIAT